MSEPVTYTQHSKAVRELLQLHKEGRLKLDPPFQRRSVWSPKQRKHLMASIFEGFPIPSIFFYRHQDKATGKAIFEVIDGKQRIESLLMFTGQGGEIFPAPVMSPDWEGPRILNWIELRKMKKQGLLEEFQVQIIEVTGVLSDIIKLFVRIDSAGSALTSAEVKNASFYESAFLKSAKTTAAKYVDYLLSAKCHWQ